MAYTQSNNLNSFLIRQLTPRVANSARDLTAVKRHWAKAVSRQAGSPEGVNVSVVSVKVLSGKGVIEMLE